MKKLRLFLVSLAVLSSACQLQQPANPSASNPSSQASSGRIMTITSETNDPKLPKILVPGLELKVFAGSGKAGYKDGPKLEAEFKSVGLMAKDSSNNLYVSDFRDVRIRKINSEGKVSTLIGDGQRVPNGKTGLFTETEFYTLGYLAYKNPSKLFIQNGSNVLKLDLKTQQSQLFLTKAVETIAPPYHNFIQEPRQLPLAFPGEIYAMAVHNNEIYIANSAEIWKLSENEEMYYFQRYAGNQFVDSTGGSIDDPARNFKDGPPDDSKFYRPASMVFDKVGNMYVSDAGNHRIRKVEAGTRNVSTLTGYGIPDPRTTIGQDFVGGFKDGDEKVAQFNFPYILLLTDSEDLLIYDSGNKALRILAQNQVRTLVKNCDCGGLLKEGSTLYVSDNKNYQIYTLDLSQLEKLKPQILK